MSEKQIKCEITGKLIPLSEGYIVCNDTGDWRFICKKAADNQCDYDFPIKDLTKCTHSFIDWIGHLNGKGWFDAKKFIDFFVRLRKENNIYGG